MGILLCVKFLVRNRDYRSGARPPVQKKVFVYDAVPALNIPDKSLPEIRIHSTIDLKYSITN